MNDKASRSIVIYVGVLFLLTGLLFLRVSRFSFVHLDDPMHLDANPNLAPLSVHGLKNIWTRPYANLYIPVTFTAWAFDAALGGESRFYRQNEMGLTSGFKFRPGMFHTTNFLFHCLNVALVFFLLFSLWDNPGAAFVGGLLFALHPVQVEPVAWVSGLRDVLSATFGLLTLNLYLAYFRKHAKETRIASGSFLLTAACFLLCVLSKPTGVVVAVIAGVLALAVQRRKLSSIFRECGLLLVLALPAMLYTVFSHETENGSFIVPAWYLRPFLALDAIGFYLGKLVFPWKLGIDYGRSPEYVRQSKWIYFTPVVLLALVGMVEVFRRKHFEWLNYALAVFVVALFPVLGFVPFFQGNSTVSDRYLYLAMLGPALALAYVYRRFEGRQGLRQALVLVFSILAFKSVLQVENWRDSVTVGNQALKVNSKSWMAHELLAMSAASEERWGEAVTHFRTCSELRPQYASFKNLATLQLNLGQFPDAILAYHRATELNPTFADDYSRMGIAWFQLGNIAEAKKSVLHALKIDPTLAEAKNGLAAIEAVEARQTAGKK